jgi:hypothetical protein
MLDEHQVHTRIPDLVIGRVDLEVLTERITPAAISDGSSSARTGPRRSGEKYQCSGWAPPPLSALAQDLETCRRSWHLGDRPEHGFWG